MRVAALNRVFHAPAVLTAATLVAFAATPAHAGSKSPAPIVYMGQSSEAGSAKASTGSAPVDREKARIRFTYPGSTVAAPAGDDELAGGTSEPTRAYASIETPSRLTPAIGETEAPKPPAVVASDALQPLAAPKDVSGQGTVKPATKAQPARAVYSDVSTDAPVFDETGVAVVYGDEFAGVPTANGEVFEQGELTAAHPSLPLPSLVQIVNVDTGQQAVVRINDRGPYVENASVQVSRRAAEALGMDGEGRANVRIRYLGAAPLQMARGEETAPSYMAVSAEPAAVITPAPVYVAHAQPELPVAKAAYSPAASVTATGNYYVQVGAFSDVSNAQLLKSQLGSQYPVAIETARVNGADFFRVRVGPQLTRKSAEGIQARLAMDGFSGGRVVEAN